MTLTDILLLCLTIITVCIPLYFRKYLSEKGKNLATTQDIDKITTIVETVKTEHAKKLEEIKQNYQLALSTKNKHQDLKIKIYCEAMEAISRASNCFVMFCDFTYSAKHFNDELKYVGFSISKVQVVGNTNTVNSVLEVLGVFNKGTLELMKARIPILDKIELINSLTSELNECGQADAEKIKNRLNDLESSIVDDQLSFSQLCVEKHDEVSEALPPFISAIRQELELTPLDFDQIGSFLSDMSSTFDSFVDDMKKYN
tara:strand:+ start:1020 stop:1793 length:774 start_codon:yes stop_codon:yes gene_type:complete